MNFIKTFKIVLSMVLLGVLSITNFVAPIGDSKNIKKIGVESSNISIESRNRLTTNRTISTATTRDLS
jgi:hypothetical protein|tara:strand:+ start:255 stop:458 length:204 start_codon:yes stop_codon:yes gene_type:complete